MQKEVNILIVDDDPSFRQLLIDILSDDGYILTDAGSVALAKKELSAKFYNIVLVDLKLPDGSGLDLVKHIKKINEDIFIIVLTGYASMESSISAMNEGAFSYVLKPINIDHLKVTIKKALKVQELSFRNKELMKNLKELSLKDSLTGLYNCGYMEERLSSELKRAKRYFLPFSIIMIDIDFFKSINDTYGHLYGDIILREFAQYLKKSARTNDVVVRYGGEEFVILLPDTNKEGATKFGGQLLSTLKSNYFGNKENKIKLKISMGIISYPDDGDSEDSDYLNLVDRVVQYIKETGGNRLSTFEMIDKNYFKDIAKNEGYDTVYKLKAKLSRMEKRVSRSIMESLYNFAKTVDAKDRYDSGHTDRMVSLVTRMGKDFNFSDREIEILKHAAILHDLGKIAVPDKILQKNKKLAKREYDKVKRHPEIGAEIIRNISSLNEMVPLIFSHHERFDNLGRDRRENIPLGAKIIGIADVYTALVSDRPYRKAYGKKEAIKIIKQDSGKQFDPRVVEVFLKTLKYKNNAK